VDVALKLVRTQKVSNKKNNKTKYTIIIVDVNADKCTRIQDVGNNNTLVLTIAQNFTFGGNANLKDLLSSISSKKFLFETFYDIFNYY